MRFKKTILVVLIVVILMSSMIVPAFADNITQFWFTESSMTNTFDGYTHWIIFYNGSNYVTVHFNEEDWGQWYVEKTSATNLKFTCPSTVYYVYNNSTTCFIHNAYAGSLAFPTTGFYSRYTGSATQAFNIKPSYLIMTNSSRLKYLLDEQGVATDDSYYMYFEDADVDEYVVCSVSVDSSSTPYMVITTKEVIYNSDTKTLYRSDGGQMYFFEVSDMSKFPSLDVASYCSSVSRGKELKNVTEFYYSTVDIYDISVGGIYFSKTPPPSNPDIEDTPLEDDSDITYNFFDHLDWSSVKDFIISVLTKGPLGPLLDAGNEFLTKFYSTISWMPFFAQNMIVGTVGLLIVVFLLFLAIKVVPLW